MEKLKNNKKTQDDLKISNKKKNELKLNVRQGAGTPEGYPVEIEREGGANHYSSNITVSTRMG